MAHIVAITHAWQRMPMDMALCIAHSLSSEHELHGPSVCAGMFCNASPFSSVAEHLACNQKVASSILAAGWSVLAMHRGSCSPVTRLAACQRLFRASCSCATHNDLGRTRTCNPRLRRLMPYPLGHEADGGVNQSLVYPCSHVACTAERRHFFLRAMFTAGRCAVARNSLACAPS